jgi:hypothetical protein
MTLKANISSLFVLILLAGATWSERRVLRDARAKNERLHAALQAAETSPSQAERTSNDSSLEVKRELARLRNEVRQLRAQKPELEKVRAGNELLAQKIAETSQSRPGPTIEQGFVMNETWANAGFATPEATIQTFFWAMRQQDLAALVNCMTPETSRKSGLIDEQTGMVRPEAVDREMQEIGRIGAYRIAAIDVQGDRAKAEIQAAVNGATIKFALRRVGQEWKLHNL